MYNKTHFVYVLDHSNMHKKGWKYFTSFDINFVINIYII